MRRFPRRIQAYILTVIAGGGVALLLSLPKQIEASDLVLFATLAVSGVLAGIYPLPLVNRHGTINLTGGVLLMAVFVANAPVACLLAAVVAIFSGLALRRRVWNICFTAGASVLSIGLASVLYTFAVEPGTLPLDSWDNTLALYVSASGYWLSISALAIVLVSARKREPFLKTYINNWREVYLQCILLTLLAVLGAAAWRQGPVYAFLLFVPAVAVYQWLSITQLKQEQAIHAIEIIGEVLDRRNPFTYHHSSRVAEYAVKLGKRLGLNERAVDVLRRAAKIHDIGMLGVNGSGEDFPPNKELTDYQFYSLKQHAHLGAMIAREIPAFEEAEEPIRYHHDWFDGTHVSREHAGEEIPLEARILAVADSYDRLCMANGEATLEYDAVAVEQLRAMAGKQLDPRLLSEFLRALESDQSSAAMPTGWIRAVRIAHSAEG